MFDEAAKKLETKGQQYDLTEIINGVRRQVERWRDLPNPSQWRVTPETVRLLQHWRRHRFSDIRPFFCQVEAVETAIWLTEVAPRTGRAGKGFLDHLANANHDANPNLPRLALKLATDRSAFKHRRRPRAVKECSEYHRGLSTHPPPSGQSRHVR